MVRMGTRLHRQADSGVDLMTLTLPMLIDGPWIIALAQGYAFPMNGLEIVWVQWNAGRWVMLMEKPA